MEFDPLMVDYYIRTALTLLAVGLGAYFLVRGFKILLYLILFMVVISCVVFFAGSFTDINVSNINTVEIWSYIGIILSKIMQFFLDIFNNTGILAILSALIGAIIGKKHNES